MRIDTGNSCLLLRRLRNDLLVGLQKLACVDEALLVEVGDQVQRLAALVVRLGERVQQQGLHHGRSKALGDLEVAVAGHGVGHVLAAAGKVFVQEGHRLLQDLLLAGALVLLRVLVLVLRRLLDENGLLLVEEGRRFQDWGYKRLVQKCHTTPRGRTQHTG